MKRNKILLCVSAVLIIALTTGGILLKNYIYNNTNGKEALNYTESEIVMNNIDTGKTVVDNETQYQTLSGFGASACWWAQEVGAWENAEEILSYLYSEDKGIGLNIYRYNLGAGSQNDKNLYVKMNRTEGFMTDGGTYDFSRDANAQQCLEIAKRLAGDNLRVMLFANSAPVQLTKNGKAYSSAPENDSDPFVSNLAPENYEAYADYLYACAEYFVNSGYRVTGISPVNEPQYKWRAWKNGDGTFSMNQEGGFYSPEEVRDLLLVLVNKFNNSPLHDKGVRLTMFECGEAEGENTVSSAYFEKILGTGKENGKYNRELRTYFDSVAIHSYWSSKETKQYAAELLKNKYPTYSVACTEYCQMTNDGNNGVLDLIKEEGGSTNGMSIDYGLAMADIIMTDLTVLNATEWNWWLGCSYGVYPDGLVYINAEDHSKIETSKRLWCLGNFSKFIEEGAVRLAASSGKEDLPMVAFKNTDGSNVLVFLNKTEKDISTDISEILQNSYKAYITDKDRDIELTDTVSDGLLTVPSKSIISIIY
ncbi:MAG: glycoside hydrolase family 30 protein [Clostridia bacterium]|nr:glycoside hydrolase family 30 protein [Clostridia bacterium]